MYCLLRSVFSPYDSICGISLLLFVLYHPRFLPIDFPWWKLVSSEHTFFPFYFSRKTMRTWKLHSTTWLKSFTIFTRKKLNRWRHWHRTFIFVVFSPWWEGRSIFSLHNFYYAFLKIEVSTFLQLKGLILGFSFLRIFQPNLLKLVYLLLFFFSFHDLSFSYKILASSSLCLVFKHSGDVCSYHSTQSMRTDS